MVKSPNETRVPRNRKIIISWADRNFSRVSLNEEEKGINLPSANLECAPAGKWEAPRSPFSRNKIMELCKKASLTLVDGWTRSGRARSLEIITNFSPLAWFTLLPVHLESRKRNCAQRPAGKYGGQAKYSSSEVNWKGSPLQLIQDKQLGEEQEEPDKVLWPPCRGYGEIWTTTTTTTDWYLIRGTSKDWMCRVECMCGSAGANGRKIGRAARSCRSAIANYALCLRRLSRARTLSSFRAAVRSPTAALEDV